MVLVASAAADSRVLTYPLPPVAPGVINVSTLWVWHIGVNLKNPPNPLSRGSRTNANSKIDLEKDIFKTST